MEAEHQILSTSLVAVHKENDDESDVVITSVLVLIMVIKPPD